MRHGGRPTANQLGVTEVMHSPSNSATTEYFELTNTTDALLDLRGLTVTYENASGVPTTFQLDPGGVPLVIGRRGRFVLAHDRNAATNGGVEAALQYPGTIVLDGSDGSPSPTAPRRSRSSPTPRASRRRWARR